jgi:hypothetical protein
MPRGGIRAGEARRRGISGLAKPRGLFRAASRQPVKLLQAIVRFYTDGFRRMTVGRKLWLIIFLKLFVLFAVFKLIFFPNLLKTRFSTDAERSNYVLEQLTP